MGKKQAPMLLFDGHSLAYRAFYALPPDLRTTTGQVTNAVYGFTSMLIKALGDFNTSSIAVCFDRGAPVERLKLRPEYKAQREAAPDEFRQQMDLIREVLAVLGIPIFEFDNVEADDLINILAKRVAAEDREVIIVTADRDFFQVVSANVKLMMNRRGISDTVIYDEAGVKERFGFGPERYLDYAALRGDPSDNIEGVAGIGEKTASKLIQAHGSLEVVFDHLEELTPRIRKNLGEAQQRLLENKQFFRLRDTNELPGEVGAALGDIKASDLQMGEWDFGEIRGLFDTLEFRILYDRLAELKPESAPSEPGFEAVTKEIKTDAALKELMNQLGSSDVATVKIPSDLENPIRVPDSIAVVTNGTANLIRSKDFRSDVWKALGPALTKANLATHRSKELIQGLNAAGVSAGDIVMDTEIAAYLVDPARGEYPLNELARQYLGRELRMEKPPSEGQASLLETGDEDPHQLGVEAVAVRELASVLEKELRNRELWPLFEEIELPLAGVLARIEEAGVKIDTGYLGGLSKKVTGELKTIEDDIYSHAGGPFNIGSPPQLREVLFDRLGLKPTKKTKTGYSTDASVLESLREAHPIVDGILRYRERSKLKSTYLDALPPLVNPKTGRIHCKFNQTVASTGRLSSDSPNLQNIPIRTEDGRQIRKAFVPEEGFLLLKADYSQIELRILAHLSEDAELMGAFNRGDDIHRTSIAKALGMKESDVTGELRSIGKMVSYGVTYGMGPFGLSQRLKIPVDQAKTYIDGFFGSYPTVREFLDAVVADAAKTGFTTTMLGRRRYLPELQSRNPRLRGVGERMALNAPIQGSAADVMKLAMIEVDKSLKKPGRIVLTVHDELVLEVPEAGAERVAKQVQSTMEGVIDLKVPLQVDVGWGVNWSESDPH